jgi:hypothetical protein
MNDGVNDGVNDGGPAFPVSINKFKWIGAPVQIAPGQFVDGEDIFEIVNYPGMSLRDYFAAKALQGICSISEKFYDTMEPETIATAAYMLADAMIRAGKK